MELKHKLQQYFVWNVYGRYCDLIHCPSIQKVNEQICINPILQGLIERRCDLKSLHKRWPPSLKKLVALGVANSCEECHHNRPCWRFRSMIQELETELAQPPPLKNSIPVSTILTQTKTKVQSLEDQIKAHVQQDILRIFSSHDNHLVKKDDKKSLPHITFTHQHDLKSKLNSKRKQRDDNEPAPIPVLMNVVMRQPVIEEQLQLQSGQSQLQEGQAQTTLVLISPSHNQGDERRDIITDSEDILVQEMIDHYLPDELGLPIISGRS
jgi:hypothetical protein